MPKLRLIWTWNARACSRSYSINFGLYTDKWRLLALLLFLAGLLSGCTRTVDQGDSGRQIQHVVICWLKDPGNIQARQRVIEATQTLNDIPGVQNIRVGSVLPSLRPVVDSSFDVGMVISFNDEDSLRRYLEHPKHTELINKVVKPFVEKFIVYDIMEAR